MKRRQFYMKKTVNVMFDAIAKNNGYSDKFSLLRDYGFIPTVLTPKHRKIEMIKLLFNHIRKK